MSRISLTAAAWREAFAINVEKKLQKLGDTTSENWAGWHSCFRGEWEAIVLFQKPLINNYIETLKKTGVGLFKTINSDGSFQSNILEGFGREVNEETFEHCTVKPLSLIQKLIEMLIPPCFDNIVLDPFAGTGTPLLAAATLGLPYIGIEMQEEYVQICRRRLETCEHARKTALQMQLSL